jgi:hypothetical protein
MATRFEGKLNQLQQKLPEGLLVDAAWKLKAILPHSAASMCMQDGSIAPRGASIADPNPS